VYRVRDETGKLMSTAVDMKADNASALYYSQIAPSYIYATGVVVLALGVTYWFITKRV
jgi:hypothetical protein